jgi:hypothetical protein
VFSGGPVRIACGRWAGTAVPAIVATVAVRPGRWSARHGPLSAAGSCRPLPERQSETTPTNPSPRDGVTMAGSEVCYQHLGTRHRQPRTPTPLTSARYHSLPLTITPAAANPRQGHHTTRGHPIRVPLFSFRPDWTHIPCQTSDLRRSSVFNERPSHAIAATCRSDPASGINPLTSAFQVPVRQVRKF